MTAEGLGSAGVTGASDTSPPYTPPTSVIRVVSSAAVRRPLILLVLLLLGTAASAHAARRSLAYKMPANALEHLGFQVEHRITTEAVELPPEAAPYDVDGLLQAVGDVTTTVSGRLERTVARVFRDRSLGLVSRVVALQAQVDRGQGPTDVPLAGLEGKSVSMRVLDSGELLASVGWEHMAGAGRGGDLVRDLLLFSVLRLPYAVPSGTGAIPSTFRLRIPEDPLLNRDQAWTLAWTAASPPADCRRCSALAWSAEVTEAAEDRHPARPMSAEGTATGSGVVVLNGRGALVAHDFSLTWTRTVRSHRENGDRRAELTQVHTVTGRLSAEAAK